MTQAQEHRSHLTTRQDGHLKRSKVSQEDACSADHASHQKKKTNKGRVQSRHLGRQRHERKQDSHHAVLLDEEHDAAAALQKNERRKKHRKRVHLHETAKGPSSSSSASNRHNDAVKRSRKRMIHRNALRRNAEMRQEARLNQQEGQQDGSAVAISSSLSDSPVLLPGDHSLAQEQNIDIEEEQPQEVEESTECASIGAYAVNQHGRVRRQRGQAGDNDSLLASETQSVVSDPRNEDGTPLILARLAPQEEDIENAQQQIAQMEEELHQYRNSEVTEVFPATVLKESKKRRCKRFVILAFVIFVAAATMAAIAVPLSLSKSSGPTQAPTFPQLLGNWQPVGQVLHGKTLFDYFGHSVSLSRDGNIIAVGAPQSTASDPGFVSVHRINTTTQLWSPLGQELIGDAGGDDFGRSVSFNGDGTILAVGAPLNGGGNAGHVRVFEYSPSVNQWIQLGSEITGLVESESFGISVSLSQMGDILAVGSLGDSGSVLLFEYNRGAPSWNQLGQPLFGKAFNDQFGVSVSLSSSGTIVAIGADFNDSGGVGAGQVSVYEYNSKSMLWVELGNPIDGQASYGQFGASVSLDDSGLTMAVGALGDFDGIGRHVSVFVHDRSSSTWSQRGRTLIPGEPDDGFGRSLSLSGNGNVLAVGSYLHDANGLPKTGRVGIFQYDVSTSDWNQAGTFLNGVAEGGEFGISLSLSVDGRIVGVGSQGRNRGSAIVFEIDPATPNPTPQPSN